MRGGGLSEGLGGEILGTGTWTWFGWRIMMSMSEDVAAPRRLV